MRTVGHVGAWVTRQKRSGAISQSAAALNAKMPMPIHTIVMVMAAGRPSLIQTTTVAASSIGYVSVGPEKTYLA
jgi:hypothetical protein